MVVVAADAESVFDYLADPRNRPAWQSSLRSVELLSDGPPAIGDRWRDRTAVGLVPEMTTIVFDRPRRWAEQGTWRGIGAVLDLELTPVAAGTELTARFSLTGRGAWKPVAALAERVATPAVRGDLRRAARIVANGPTGEG
jgi:uncharacterized membrane protein